MTQHDTSPPHPPSPHRHHSSSQPPDERSAPAHDVGAATGTLGLPVAPSLFPTLQAAHVSQRSKPVDGRVVFISALAIALGLLAGLLAQALTALIALATNLAFFGRLSLAPSSPAAHHLGWFAVLPPIVGGLLVGLMARYGSKAIRGHGIPEAMEQVLLNSSRIAPRLTFLKPLSAAIAIGTGGPFGAEGPIIATGGAFGSLVGQVIQTTAIERKTLLAAGAAAGMAATFGTPVAAVLLAVELLLFEFRARSIIPVALASAAAAAVRIAWHGSAPAFAMADVAQPGAAALAGYVLLGALMGLAAVAATRAVYAIEDAFERLPIHWMWWPALGGLAVGLVGLIEPSTLGVGYDNIEHMLNGTLTWRMLLALGVWKFVSWAIALGSGTSGGTLAPLFTVGGALGGLLCMAAATVFPDAGLDPRMAALVGMTALFAGASHALLAWVVFAVEATRQSVGLLPLLAGAATAYLISMLCMRYSIMTEKIARRGVPVARGYEVDHLRQALVRDWASRRVVTLALDDRLDDVHARLASEALAHAHQAFPVLDADGRLAGIVSRRDIALAPARAPDARRIGDLARCPAIVTYDDATLRDAADEMVRHDIGRLPVVSRTAPSHLLGIVTRSDLLRAHGSRLDALHRLDAPLATAIGARLTRAGGRRRRAARQR